MFTFYCYDRETEKAAEIEGSKKCIPKFNRELFEKWPTAKSMRMTALR
jgi:hypothetical protein